MSHRNSIVAALAMLTTLAVVPGVAHADPNGFQVRHEVSVAAPPEKVYESLVTNLGQWWNPQHSYSGDSKNMTIDARPGGCFCEKLSGGGGVEHARVIFASPGKVLRMSGALGPLQGSGVVGTLTFKLTKTADGTTVEMTYVVGGFMQGGFDALAPAVESVLEDQLQRFERFVETGSPAPKPDPAK